MTDSPLTNVQRDNLIRVMTRQVEEAHATIAELRAELVQAYEQIAALKRGVSEEIPF